MGRVQLIEVLWLLITGTALYPAVMNAINQSTEIRALREHDINGEAMYVAVGYRLIEWIILANQGLCFLVGILAIFLPAYPRPRSVLGLIEEFSVFAVGMGISMRSWVAWTIRRHYFAYSKAQLIIKSPKDDG